MKKSINKHLKNYTTLGTSKVDFRNKILDETGWCMAKFYEARKGDCKISPIEAKCIETHFNHFKQVQKDKKAYALPN